MDPKVALHFYDAAKKVQLRIDGLATMHADDDAAAEAWRATRAFSRLCYRIQPSPGSEIDDPSLLQGPVKATSDDAGRENFAAVSVSIHNIEWLYLAARGHRRARFVWNSDTLSAHWLVP